MKLVCLVLAALLCTSALAIDCTTFKTKDTCTDTTCKFTETTKTCTNNCAGVAIADCGVNAATTNLCEAVVTACEPKDTTCSTANDKVEGECTKAGATCQFVKGNDASCTAKETTTAACTNANADKTTCEAVGTSDCSYDYEFGSCKLRATTCETGGLCNNTYCDLTPAVCQPAHADCTSITDQGDCNTAASQGCIWDTSCKADVNTCKPAGEGTTDCPTTKCQQVSDSSCAAKSSDKCALLTTESTCSQETASCEIVEINKTCTLKNTICDVNNCNTNKCDKVDKVENKCNNATCDAAPTCGANCNATTKVCQATATKGCKADSTTTEECTGSGYCTLTVNGTCASNSTDGDNTNGIILAFTSLIAFLIMLF